MSIMDYFKDGGDSDTLVESPPKVRNITCDEINNLRETLNLICDKGLEMTTTFKPEIHQRYKSITLTRMVFDLLSSLKVKENESLKVCLIGEFSETGRYHMHGAIYCNSPRLLNTIRRKFAKNIGRTEIKMIHDTQKYIDYIFKGCSQNRTINDQEVIRYTKLNYNTKNIPKNYSG